MAYMHIIPM